MRILVCGGRDFQDKNLLNNVLNDICERGGWQTEKDEYGNWLPMVTIINGKAKGADLLSSDWAIVNWCPLEEYPADWNKHGRAAGPIRNQQMLDEGKPDLVVAFPGGKGTAHMIKIAKKAGVEVIEV